FSAISGWGHPKLSRGAFVQTAARTITCFIDRACHRSPFSKLRLQPIQPPRVGVLTRSNAGDAFEGALQMMLMEIDLRADGRKRQSSVKVRFDVAADMPHHFDLWVTNGVLGLTAAASAKAR